MRRKYRFFVKRINSQDNFDINGLIKYCNEYLIRGYTVIPFLNSENCLGQTTVSRMHLTRDTRGKCKRIKVFPHVKVNKNIDIANDILSALIITREQLFLEQFYPDSFEKIAGELKKLFNEFTDTFPKKIACRLESFRIDLGINQEGDIYIYEVKMTPGVGFMAYPIACAQVEYSEWLAEKAQLPYKHNFLPLNLRRELLAEQAS